MFGKKKDKKGHISAVVQFKDGTSEPMQWQRTYPAFAEGFCCARCLPGLVHTDFVWHADRRVDTARCVFTDRDGNVAVRIMKYMLCRGDTFALTYHTDQGWGK